MRVILGRYGRASSPIRAPAGINYLHVRLKNGRLVRLSLDVVRVSPGGREGDKRVFHVSVVG